MERPGIVQLRVSGTMACFTQPEFGVERASYPWMTPSAARGVLEAVFWKPRIRYEVRRISVLRPIRFMGIRRNEIGAKISERALGPDSRMDTDLERQQRNMLTLMDVDYLVDAEIWLNQNLPPQGADDNHGKFVGMFERRLHQGQHYHAPYLGCREFSADVRPADGTERAIPVDMDYGWMFYDFLYPTDKVKKTRPLFFKAAMCQGVVQVPPRQDVLRLRGGEGA